MNLAAIGFGFWMALLVVLVFLVSIALHELGHYIYWRLAIDKNVKFHRGFNVQATYTKGEVPKRKIYEFFFAGILAGLLPIAFVLIHSWLIALILLIPYAVGCRRDIKEMEKIARE